MKRLTRMCVMMAIASVGCAAAQSQSDDPAWWPQQRAPRKVVTVTRNSLPTFKGDDLTRLCLAEMLLESLAGLAAKAVNDGAWDEMVWYDLNSQEYDTWKPLAKARLKFKDAGETDLLALLKRYYEAGLVKGYVLYHFDYSERGAFEYGAPYDESANAATVVGALQGGVLVSEELEADVKALGIPKLFDARGKDQMWCLEAYGDQLSRKYTLVQDPRIANVRSLVYTTPMMVVYGLGASTEGAYARMEAPGAVIGWNGGSEIDMVRQMSEYGHVLVPCNWSANVGVLGADSEHAPFPGPLPNLDPRQIDFEDDSPTISFLLSDGDNLQWMMGNFFHHKSYWAGSKRQRDCLDFGACLAQIQMAAPDLYTYLIKTAPQSSVFQMSAGYFYPDVFASKHPAQRREILRKHARRLNQYLKRIDCRLIEFIMLDWESPASREAYDIMAEELDSVIGILAIEYAPYHGGGGEVIWAKGHNGREIPVLSCRYSLWAHLDLDRAGAPNKIARLVKSDAQSATAAGESFHHWVVVHAWSGFRNSATESEKEHGQYEQSGSFAGVKPTYWTAQKLKGDVRQVPIEETIWRLHMQRSPDRTQQMMAGLKK